MNRFAFLVAGLLAVVVVVVAAGFSGIIMPGDWKAPQLASYSGIVPAEKLLRVPVTGLYPGGNSAGLNTSMQNPLKDDPDAAARGMKDFDNFNCSGCHMPNGGGGMGPALSNNVWLYRDSPANIYLSIAQGRGAGMPAFGAMLPDRTIWELVAYIQDISDKHASAFGTTTSAAPSVQPEEQVPVGQIQSPTPWKFTEPVPPNGEKNGVGEQRPDAPLPRGAERAPESDRVVTH